MKNELAPIALALSGYEEEDKPLTLNLKSVRENLDFPLNNIDDWSQETSSLALEEVPSWTFSLSGEQMLSIDPKILKDEFPSSSDFALKEEDSLEIKNIYNNPSFEKSFAVSSRMRKNSKTKKENIYSETSSWDHQGNQIPDVIDYLYHKEEN